MKTIDRYLFVNFLAAYFICFVSMVGLFIIIDLFANIDEFLEDHAGAMVLFRRAGTYYFFHSFEYFARLSPIITQISAMVTLANLHRHNELVALLAAGIPTRRALVPVLFGASLVIGFGVFNREVILPSNSELLQRLHENIEATKGSAPTNRQDKDHVLIRAKSAYHENARIEEVNVTLPIEILGQLIDLQCAEAFNEKDPQTGQNGWRLVKATPSDLPLDNPGNGKLKRLPSGDLFLTTNLTFVDMIRRKEWKMFASIADLLRELESDDGAEIRSLIHSRLMQPVLNLILVLIGIPFVLQWENRNIFRSIAVSMFLSSLFMVADGVSSYFSNYGYIDPVSAAWLPVFIFGPLSVTLFYKMGT